MKEEEKAKEIKLLNDRHKKIQDELLRLSKEKFELLNTINSLMCNQPCECEKCMALSKLFRKVDK